MIAPRAVVVGGLTLDSVMLSDGSVDLRRAGGNCLWAAAGARLWGVPTGIVARAGEDYPQDVLDAARGAGVRLAVRRMPGPHPLRISYAYAYGEDGERVQPAPAERVARLAPDERGAFADSTMAGERPPGADPGPDDVPETWWGAEGWHLPLVSVAAHRALAAAVRRHTTAHLQADLPNRSELADLAEDIAPSIDLLDLLLPSTSDFAVFAPGRDALVLAASIADRVPIVLKRGAQGASVLRGADRVDVPAVATTGRDATGAGDAFCGGVLAAVLNGCELVEAARRGAVSAAFALEARTPLELFSVPIGAAEDRLRSGERSG